MFVKECRFNMKAKKEIFSMQTSKVQSTLSAVGGADAYIQYGGGDGKNGIGNSDGDAAWGLGASSRLLRLDVHAAKASEPCQAANA